ncbi:hypothetical protein ACG74X_10880 [Marivita sp. S0852]|uniref:hypothetical protein n=1 Tax=Marivita sp. S0852 TaxID=3373893 RepID=UPI003982A991
MTASSVSSCSVRNWMSPVLISKEPLQCLNCSGFVRLCAVKSCGFKRGKTRLYGHHECFYALCHQSDVSRCGVLRKAKLWQIV